MGLVMQGKQLGTLNAVQAAARLGISRRTLHRWVEKGILNSTWTEESIDAVAKLPRPKPGRPRSRYSARYTRYRHKFPEERSKES